MTRRNFAKSSYNFALTASSVAFGVHSASDMPDTALLISNRHHEVFVLCRKLFVGYPWDFIGWC